MASQSLRRRLMIRLLPGTLLLSAAAGTAVYVSLRRMLTDDFDVALMSKAKSIAALVEVMPDGRLDFEFSERYLPEYQRDGAGEEYFQIWRESDGSVFARSPSARGADLSRIDVDERSREGDLLLPDGRRGRAVWLTFHPRPEHDDERQAGVSPVMRVCVASDRAVLDGALWRLLALLAGTAAALAAGTAGIVWLAVKRGLRPLEWVADAAARLDASTLKFQFPASDLPAELRPIAERLNDLLRRLDEAFGRERRFTAHVAHELRTPIAELRSLSEVALKWPGDARATAAGLNGALAVATQMEAIVTTLLSLVRCQAGRQEIRRELLDVGDVVVRVLESLAPAARAKGLTIDCDTPDSIGVETDRVLFRSMLENLLSNAVSHSPRDGEVVVRARASGGLMTLTIANASADLAVEDLPRLCEPFWRKDSSRSDASHAGLGLALVRAHAVLLRMEVRFELSGDGTFAASVDAPLASAAARSFRRAAPQASPDPAVSTAPRQD